MSLLRRTWAWLGSRSAVRVVQLIMLVVTATVVWLAREQSENVACNTRFNAESAEYDRERSAAAASERRAQDDLWRHLRDNPTNFRAEIDRYLAARQAADEARSKAPVVRPPADLCQ